MRRNCKQPTTKNTGTQCKIHLFIDSQQNSNIKHEWKKRTWCTSSSMPMCYFTMVMYEKYGIKSKAQANLLPLICLFLLAQFVITNNFKLLCKLTAFGIEHLEEHYKEANTEKLIASLNTCVSMGQSPNWKFITEKKVNRLQGETWNEYQTKKMTYCVRWPSLLELLAILPYLNEFRSTGLF